MSKVIIPLALNASNNNFFIDEQRKRIDSVEFYR